MVLLYVLTYAHRASLIGLPVALGEPTHTTAPCRAGRTHNCSLSRGNQHTQLACGVCYNVGDMPKHRSRRPRKRPKQFYGVQSWCMPSPSPTRSTASANAITSDPTRSPATGSASKKLTPSLCLSPDSLATSPSTSSQTEGHKEEPSLVVPMSGTALLPVTLWLKQ